MGAGNINYKYIIRFHFFYLSILGCLLSLSLEKNFKIKTSEKYSVTEVKPMWADTLGFLCLGLGKISRGEHNNCRIMLAHHFSAVFIVDEFLRITE